MSKHRPWFPPQQPKAVVPAVPPIGPDAPTVGSIASEEAPREASSPQSGLVAGQVWEGVIVPDRPVNVLALRPGAVLAPLVLDTPCRDGTDHWFAHFLGESVTTLRVDEEMCKTGRLRG